MLESDQTAGEFHLNARDLGTVCFATLGVWSCLQVVWLVAETLGSMANVQVVLSVVPWWVAAALLGPGAFLFLAARWIAALTLPRRHASAPVQLVPLLTAALGLLGVGVALGEVDALIRVLLPFLAYQQSAEIPWQQTLADVFTAGVGVLVFARAGAIARLWGRWNTWA